MRQIKMFEEFKHSCEIDFQKIADMTPDSDFPSETCQLFSECGKMVYVEGWCDRCFSNDDVDEDDRETMVKLAKERTHEVLRGQPYLPQNRQLRGYKLVDWKFIELPENELNYAVSIGVYDKINNIVFGKN